MKKFILPFFLLFTFPAFLLSANDITFEKVYSDKDGEEFHKIKHENFPGRIFMISSLHFVEGVNRIFCGIKNKGDGEANLISAGGLNFLQYIKQEESGCLISCYECDFHDGVQEFCFTFGEGNKIFKVKGTVDISTKKISVSGI